VIIKALGLLAPVAAIGFYLGGAFDAGYARDVNGSPAQVMAALEDLDVRRQPGSPGTDASRSGGVTPVFRTERNADGISFVVMSGDQVATRMTARLEPLDGGARTRVTALVERGDAPDALTSPAFQSPGLTMALFTSALNDELNALEAPPAKSPEECAELERNMNGDQVFEGAQAIIRVHQMEAEMRRNGCSTRAKSEFRPIVSQMSPAAPSQEGWGAPAGPAQDPGAGWGNGGR
jgi:hypothetical protein